MDIKENILFSIIVPTYNRAHLISKTIKSVLVQEYTNWELIIVDDGSTDNTKEIVNSFNDSRIKYYYKINEERGAARNYGIDRANGLYISFLDDDDLYLPGFLTEFHKIINDKSIPISMIMCDEFIEDSTGKRTVNKIPSKLLSNPVRLLWEIQTSIRPFVFHKNIFENNRFKIDCKYGQDFHLALRIALKYPFEYLNKFLTVNLHHENQGTNKKFIGNYHENAKLSIMCIENLINSYQEQLTIYIPQSILNNLLNHKFYGFSSAAMKQCDFKFSIRLLKSVKYISSPSITFYYVASLIFRIPYYLIKCLFKSR